ncbi:ribulokinase [Consotaella salsifontis]|uniref:Ribulokinase n=1 Tax=Consotaella salsifontis TaxID=1365950 RepID=A0A1T4T3U6_9HYPH|nr:ribulokinase [Consotaella salsifontis]SKA35067.1 L-ribulokinase [Consotaella salsifontis]
MPSAVDSYVVGLDFGTDSVRAVLMRVDTGEEVRTSVEAYERWARGEWCEPTRQQFRQHPLDHAEAMTRAVRALFKGDRRLAEKVVGIGVDTTGSSPLPVDAAGQPLAFSPEFANDPDALCILWKDHTSVAEAEEINALCHSPNMRDYTRYVGGIYSSEWFWAKILHTYRRNPRVQAAAASWVEFCDWIPALLTGVSRAEDIVRGVCAAGHKALWNPDFGGLPPKEFFAALDERLLSLPHPLFGDPVTTDHPAGHLSAEWAERLGLSERVAVAVGAFDCHMGAVGGGITPYTFARVVGTSTCDILMAPPAEVGDTVVQGICGQVPGSVLPGYVGFEAGQSSFGDVFAWFAHLLSYGATSDVDRGEILKRLEAEASALQPGAYGERALDWLNGRRTPDADQRLRAMIAGLHLGSTAPSIYRALVEATAFGGRAIVDRFEAEGIPVKRVMALGGIPQKSPLVMQISADVLNRPIAVVESSECCARGAGIFAAAAAGEYRTVHEAQAAMQSKILKEYQPNPEAAAAYEAIYRDYVAMGAFEKERASAHAKAVGDVPKRTARPEMV